MTAIESYEDHETRAWRDFSRAAGSEMRTSDVPERRDGTSFSMAAPRCTVAAFNRTLGIGCRSPATVEEIGHVMAWYEDRGVDRYSLQLGARAVPRSVEQWLLRHRFTHSYRSALLSRSLAGSSALPRCSLEVRRIGAESASVFGRVAAAAYGWPAAAEGLAASVVGRDGWHHYLAYDGPTVVGCGAAYYAEGLAWIGFGGVVASHRRLGGQAMLITRRIVDAFKLCHTAIVDTTEGSPSYRNCLRLGFQHVGSRPVYRCAQRRGLIARMSLGPSGA